MEKAQELDPRTPTAIMEILSASNSTKCAITEDDVRHMFRNFADTEMIVGVYPQNLPARIDFSLREVEITLYCLLNDFNKLIKCRELMTYRPRALSAIFGKL